ncbi:hypothetical protein TNCT_615981 [Trichonephila clavata]|uniref:Uncharacterized protein n=1 Tax=Trichonephila clavata TaxID=2740835 RepID=A0A8X6IJT2_TRICU|nr:hypothetical protein TNCT_615981 [Trichonephila clavata]
MATMHLLRRRCQTKKNNIESSCPEKKKKDGNWCAKHPLMTYAHSQQETMGSKQGSRQVGQWNIELRAFSESTSPARFFMRTRILRLSFKEKTKE